MAKTLIILFFATLFLGVPVAFTMGIAGLSAIFIDGSLNPLVATQRMFAGIDSFPLMAVPFFILASELMTACGLTNALLRFANALVGHVRGGLGHVNILVSMLFAGISGSALADAAGPSAIVMRMMREAGYEKNYAGALSAATATIGPIIPPSILAVIFAISTNGVTVAGLFLAGIVPGVLLGVALAIANHIVSTRNGYRGREHRATMVELRSATLSAIPALIMPAIILGGILFGVFTPTEAGAVASAYALFLGFILRAFTVHALYAAFVRAAVVTSSVFLIVAMASIFAWLLTYLQIPQELAKLITQITENRLGILFILAAFALICGFFIDTLPALIILTPILGPIAYSAGIDPLQFGMMLVLNLTIGMITPPVGPVLFVIATVGQLKIERLSKAVLPLLLAELVVLLLVILVPGVSTFIPNFFGFAN
ncbi:MULTISPECIES: TRAP transporter large permease [unclassified Ruegeria]|uniref:TRAP transporter large permease n=1 Tax=unclassified Ruegeria TaxID=2625375 RepID=UPI00148980ED|nr:MULTISPECIES: TRAP transporter large permease [unclassified Ruegeria]NOD76424.1 TRAP transporter large permease subunit [Ruegeria sp. HKCCD4332]NOD89137.1 TRAP transporter large permease subunit [Ruegeria sp. HKCCD4318]NOD92597.1 TRAP transporter large permease subunit [Ruegeria sp. HKCCD4884]NOE13700.1 TRAP transporter large permease subunit [Ruegeria sp. HKCCD4318-2]NOG07549.1 TRAP transporter large permease [Ruegeria sp. HKCCD4315]